MIKNVLLSVEDYKKYISMFELDSEESAQINEFIEKVQTIYWLKRETVQDNTKRYLKPIMTPDDYRKINKVLKDQKELKVERELEKYRKELIKEGRYTNEQMNQMIEEKRKKLREEFGLSKIKNKKKEQTKLTLADLKGGIKDE